MSDLTVIDVNRCYKEAEQKASQYFSLLQHQIQHQSYIQSLTEDIRIWKKYHVHTSVLSIFSSKNQNKPNSTDYQQYLKWLDYKGKLKSYLERSVSYIFLRDLGKTLDNLQSQKRIHHIVEDLIEQIKNPEKKQNGLTDLFNLSGMFRKAQKEKIETTIIWLFEKLHEVEKNLPEKMDGLNAKRKLVKIIAGVLMHVNEETYESLSEGERVKRLEDAIRLGYSYGLTYPFIDDLLDSNVLNSDEKKRYSKLIERTLTTGEVPDFGVWEGTNQRLMQYIHSELKEAFMCIKQYQKEPSKFFEQAYVFFQSQEIDREKSLSNPSYTNEELFIPIILKSSSSRLIARTIVNVEEDEGFDQRTFLYGIYNQLADDFSDLFQDQKDGGVTPYTYYLKYYKTRNDLLNPFELYWVVIENLIHNVYHSDSKTREVILDRAINGLKRFKEKVGNETYHHVMDTFKLRNRPLYQLIDKMVKKADDVDFYDKLLRDRMLEVFRKDKEEQQQFINTIENVRALINENLTIDYNNPLDSEPVIEAANYSLKVGGKRLRPIMTWFMGVNVYNLNEAAILPLLKSLEYMHTASLIFDDLPTQDNASTRRGNPTVHEIYNASIAELSGLFLTQKAFEEQASMDQFDAKSVLRLIQYAARMTAEMCQGQAMDLQSKGKSLSLEELNTISFYKTGLGFEACLVMPAILANASEVEKGSIKKFARHAGIAFQIKDDLLDVVGDTKLLGKKIGKDAENNNSTFVSILGVDGAKKEMWNHYCIAMESLESIPRNTAFLKHFLNYIVNREK